MPFAANIIPFISLLITIKIFVFRLLFFFILIRFLWYYKYKHGEIKRVMLLVLIWCRFSCSWSVIYVDDN